MMWPCVVKVNACSVGDWRRHESLTPRDCLHSLSAVMAFSFSYLAGARSSGSSIRLKSPRRRSGFGSRRASHFSFNLFQKLGAYILIALNVALGCHLNEMKMARPGMSMCVTMFLAFISSLFITKATPAELDGLSGCGAFMMVSLRWHRVVAWSASCSERWVSCRASSPIFFSLMVFEMADHFEIGPAPVSCEVRPFIFREAILRLALYFLFVEGGAFTGVGVGCDVGGVRNGWDPPVTGGSSVVHDCRWACVL